MANITENTIIKRLRNKYRLVVSNDDTFEELVTFKLSRVSLYATISCAFVLLVGLTICMLVFTPLKYYIPGYGNKKTLTQLQLLKVRTDSLEEAIIAKEQYFIALQKAFKGDATMVLDTNKINIANEAENTLPTNTTTLSNTQKKDKEKEEKPKRRRHRR